MAVVESRGRAGEQVIRPRSASPVTRRGALAPLIDSLLGSDLPIGFRAYDGTQLGPPDPPASIVVHSPDALRRMATAPGELGLARAYVAGDIDLEGDIFAALEVRNRISGAKIGPHEVLAILRLLGPSAFRPLPPPPEEAKPRGRLHSRSRDAAAIQHHYDVGNEFYELLLGDTMTYSCAVWEDADHHDVSGLNAAQEAKYELICRKLDLRPGQRLLDVGCGWGGMARHAVRHHGVRAVGITLSPEQARWARARNEQEGLADRIEIRLQDYRDISDGPFDAISSIGMFEHVGRSRLRDYFTRLYALLPPEGRLLNHAISRPPNDGERINPRGFMARYVFPDGELIEVGSVVTELQSVGFEARHVEDLREHYALTLRAWMANLEANWDEAVRLVGRNRARIWRLYLAGCAVNFDDAGTQVYQVLGVKLNGGRSGMDLRPTWDRRDLRAAGRGDGDGVIVLD
jgi:cyclopropane-fatty-acyl-phospholipid synthase